MGVKFKTLPRAFIWRRLHSLFGLWIVIFLIEHLLTNSQAALLIGQNGEGFIRAVNFIKNLPYLPVIEIVLLGVPFLLHMVWGIGVLMSSKMNSLPTQENLPTLTKFPRNHAYSLQRITSWILLVGILAHVGFMRFYMYPVVVDQGQKEDFFVRITIDSGLYTVADRLGVKLYDQEAVDSLRRHIESEAPEMEGVTRDAKRIQEGSTSEYSASVSHLLSRYQNWEDQKAYLEGMEYRTLSPGEVIAEAPDFGTATLLIVRDAFKSVFTAILYTIFVLAAVFHGFNGLWTFMISWGIVLKMRSQSMAVNVCVGLMLLVGFLGLASIWGTYFINLRN
ncbi:MAG: Succinate dehydrogenase cytochrome b558 subunit [Chlamydiae bacterium]|nr:Succinate dehydrogenase cytochrome b558 subunit [Chlamydiota bacterium]